MLDTAAVIVDQTAMEGSHGVEAAGHECHFSRCARESPFIVSGEIFLRSTQTLLFSSNSSSSSNNNSGVSSTDKRPQGHHRDPAERPACYSGGSSSASGHPSAGLLAGLPQNLRDLLLCHPDSIATVANGGADAAGAPLGDLSGLVAGARIERRAVRRNRVGYLKASKTMALGLTKSQLAAVQKAAGSFREGCLEGRARLDASLGGLVVRFAAATGAEMAAEDARIAAEGEHYRRETERLELAARLASLAATVEHRTRGSVLLRRLPPTHPQHARCLRAATENVRPGFFSSESPYGAVQVLDIYKIENRLLLERFQRAAEARDPRKVKGLFCHVPDESLEHTVMFGMGGAAALMDDCSGSSSSHTASPAKAAACPSLYDWNGDPIDSFVGEASRTKLSLHGVGSTESGSGGNRGNATTDGSHAGAKPNGSSKRPLEFPRAFSRHSTLEEERDYANTDQRRHWEENGVRHRRFRSPPAGEESGPEDAYSGTPIGPQRRRRHRASGEEFGGTVQQGRAVSDLRFLALCRVMIGSMHVASASSRSPTATAKHADAGHVGTSSLPSNHSSSSRSGTNSPPWTQQQQQQHDSPSPALCHRDQFSLPPPPPGHADYDAVYFPQDEEYRLLNEDFVLPEFLVVHRFVAAAKSAGSTRTRGAVSDPSSTPSSIQNVNDIAPANIAGASDVDVGAKAQLEKWVAGGQAHEREKQQQQQLGRYGRPSGDVARAREHSSAPARAPQQDAASVVAGIEAAIEGVASPHPLALTTLGSGERRSAMPLRAAAAAFSLTTSDYGRRNFEVSMSCDGTHGGSAGSLMSGPEGGSGDAVVVNGSNDDCRRREPVGEAGRARRDPIERDVKSEFESYWQEIFRLREVEKDEVMRSVLSRRNLRHPP